MENYISFLRGVNMAGHNSVTMANLTALYKDLGFTCVEAYIQSGNVFFRSIADLTKQETASKIEDAILKRFKYNIPVMLRTVEELLNLFSANPFLEENYFEPSKMAVIFLHEKPTEIQIQKVININYPPDKFNITGNEIFIYCPNGFGKTKLYTNFFEKKMGVTGTARNWNTITTILQIANKR